MPDDSPDARGTCLAATRRIVRNRLGIGVAAVVGMADQDTRRCTPAEIDSVRAPRTDSPAGHEADEDPGTEEPIIISAPPAPRLEVGRLIEGRLRILRLLGRGGMSEVYEAYDERARRTVAVKLMLVEECQDAQLAIFSEARALVAFQHEHVVRFYGVGAIEAQPFVELEAASGGSVSDRCLADGAMSIADALDLLLKAASGLAALHQAGIVHRDIKADNLLLTESGRVVIADFGLAMHKDDLPALPVGIVGTPAYMAPEAILGITETFDQYAWADQYSLGVTAYYLLTGTLPFDAPTPSALFYAQMALEPDPPSRRRPALPAALDGILCKALAKRPADRFPNVSAFLDALAEVRVTLPVDADAGAKEHRESGVRTIPHPALRPTVVAAG